MSSPSSSYFFFFLFFSLGCSLSCLAGGAQSSQARRAGGVRRHQLSGDFYEKICPEVEKLVGGVTSLLHKEAPASGPATVRLFFHDCFVDGCDASVLVEAGAEGKAAVEREMPENRNLAAEGFENVGKAKAAVEEKCPGVVSCADVLAIAARDFVHLAGGPFYEVQKGRKDSKASSPTKVSADLPRSNATVDQLLALFARKGLSAGDLVALSGAHTIGFAHCDQFVSRLYGTAGEDGGAKDAPMDRRLLQALRMQCPRAGGNADVVAPLDVETPFEFDNRWYEGLGKGMGVLGADEALGVDRRTAPEVRRMAGDRASFFAAFAAGMERMGGIGVKKGRRGEIRRSCGRHLVWPPADG
ncbi:Peroxidase 19 [Apostasia shenzhenica]|uniref:Peroxidase n=1 Tax=Apostasia shenzhenica TaxID=1088818 RepID=A0A2I0A278_9ASPA|nr:Peroxidase 19 [Apostasia shenzhenica]